jgi:hypothetical protein
MYFNLFNCPLNKSVCLSIDGPRLLSLLALVCLSQTVRALMFDNGSRGGLEAGGSGRDDVNDASLMT